MVSSRVFVSEICNGDARHDTVYIRGLIIQICRYQEVDRVAGANDSKKVQDVLKYYDTFAGTDRMNHISDIQKLTSRSSNGSVEGLTDLMRAFNIEVDNEPMTFEAERLRAPVLEFGNENESNTLDGSWNLRSKRFKV